MPSVLGNPILKGNSNVTVACSLSTTSPVDKVVGGLFVSRTGGSAIEPIVANLSEGGLYGIATELRAKCGHVSVTRKAEAVLVQTDGTSPANGSKILVNVDGKVSATGTYTGNGTIMTELENGYNQDGDLVVDCVFVSLNDVEFAGGAPAATTSKGA